MYWNLYVHTSECMGWVHVPSFSVLKETLCLDRRDPYSHGCRRGPERDTTRSDVTERLGGWGLQHWWSQVCGQLWTGHGRQRRSLHSETFSWLILLKTSFIKQTESYCLMQCNICIFISLPFQTPGGFYFKIWMSLSSNWFKPLHHQR